MNKLEDELIQLQTKKTTLTNKLKLINVRLKNYEKKKVIEEGGKIFNSNGLSDIDIDNLLTNRHKMVMMLINFINYDF